MLNLKVRKVGLLGADKRRETLTGHKLDKDWIKEDPKGKILSG